jgi:apolipoprotein D and lipocalin family protein
MDTSPKDSMKSQHRWLQLRQVTVLCLALFLAACTGMPEGVQPVGDFELDRYLGKWYEIARLDHSFERGLTQVTAEYSLRDDGGVRVVNRGFSADKGEWNEAEGKAYFVESPDRGYLKVSFFGPFYGSYVVFELDKQGYEYAFISGPDTSYLWLLARTPTVSSEILQRFLERAAERGFDTDALILVDQG